MYGLFFPVFQFYAKSTPCVIISQPRNTSCIFRQSQIENLSNLRHRLIWVLDRMTNRPRVLVDLVIISTNERLVAEEMNGCV